MLIGAILLLLAGAATLTAAPKLRLSDAAIGPVDIAAGANGPAFTVEASNTGDGALDIAVSSSEAWLSATLGTPAGCASGSGTCVPIEFTLATAGLERGVHTGIVTVTDPNAFDAPQTITVTVQIGGGVPDEVEFLVPPGGSGDIRFESNNELSARATTQSGGDWLSLAMEGAGSFDFALPYRIRARSGAALADGVYQGSINVTGSGFAPDVKQVPVTMRVTLEPIGALSNDQIDFTLAAETSPSDQYLSFANRGLGSLTVGAVEVSTKSGVPWLEAWMDSGYVIVRAIPAGLSPGDYEGGVTIESNAVNSPHTVAVRFQVVAQSAPVAQYRGVVNNATFLPEDPIPQGGIAAVFGKQLSHVAPAVGTEIPLVEELGGARVLVNGVDAPLFYSSERQINIQLPYETRPGEAQIQVIRDGQLGNTVTVQVTARSPRLLTLLDNYALAVNTDETFPVPPTPVVPSRPARPGDVLVMYAIGFGTTHPEIPTGDAAPLEPLSHVGPTPTIILGGGLLPTRVTPAFVGLTPTFVGLYQINFTIPESAPRGDEVPLVVQGFDYVTNRVRIAIQ